MTRLRAWTVLGSLAALIGLPGCAYYNSMYYANRYRNEAEKAERAGRSAEAADRWRLASVHADSQLSRHPRSRWADDALLVRGQALLHLRQWSDAVVALERAVAVAPAEEQRRTAQLFLGEANAGLRRYDAALPLLDSAVTLRDGRRRSRALLARGRVLLELGRPRDALDDLVRSQEPAALVERVRAAITLREPELAAAYGDSLAMSRHAFREASWAPLLDSLASAGLAERVSRLVDRLAERDDAGRGARARLFLAEGDRRLLAGDLPAAVDRFRAVQRLTPDSIEARMAETRLMRLTISETTLLDDLLALRDRLRDMQSLGGEPAREAGQLDRLIALTDSLRTVDGFADALWFFRAELLRDSIGARRLALDAFAAMGERFPDSPWTPKALIAAITGGHPAADSLRALLLERYPASPYTAALRGGADEARRFAVLEDSLGALIAALAPRRPQRGLDGPVRPGTAQPGPRQTDQPQRGSRAPEP